MQLNQRYCLSLVHPFVFLVPTLQFNLGQFREILVLY